MIRLASLIDQFEADFLDQYSDALLPGQHHALAAMKTCRTRASRQLQVTCGACQHTDWIPHACGHRAGPHCQHHEAEQWLARQRQRQLPVRYFLVTFTLPAELRDLTWAHQRQLYDAMLRCSWQTLAQFARNDRQLRGQDCLAANPAAGETDNSASAPTAPAHYLPVLRTTHGHRAYRCHALRGVNTNADATSTRDVSLHNKTDRRLAAATSGKTRSPEKNHRKPKIPATLIALALRRLVGRPDQHAPQPPLGTSA